MALTGWSTSNYLSRNEGVWPGALPFYVSMWVNGAASGTFRTLFHLPFDTSNTNARYIEPNDNNKVIVTENGSAAGQAVCTNAHPNSTWFHVGGAFISGTSREVWMDASDDITNATTTSMSQSPTKTWIGRRPDGSLTWLAAGAIAELSIWNTNGFISGDYDSLDVKLRGTGNPLNITAEAAQPWSGKLLCYVIDSANTLTDLSGNGKDFTMTGTLTNFASHPTIDAVSGGGGGSLMGAILM